MQFLHMHHAMANTAIMQINYIDGVMINSERKKIRDRIMTGEFDYKDRWQPVTVTNEDRELVCKYLGV